MIFYSLCKISEPIWLAKHYFNIVGCKESRRHAAEENMKKFENEFQLESLSSSHYGDNFENFFPLQVLWFYVVSALFFL